MKRIYVYVLLLLSITMLTNCKNDFPVDEDGLLITDKSQCYISGFNLRGSDSYSVFEAVPTLDNGIDTINCVIVAEARFGTNIKHVKPECSVSPDSKVEPAMGQWMDFTTPQTFTVISGNRKIRKVYTIAITVKQ